MSADARAWIDRYVQKLGVPPLDDDAVSELLELAGVAAHASERIAAPLSCWLAGTAGVTPGVALERARSLAEELS